MDKGALAFPQHPSQMNGTERTWGDPGMSLRDWFAGQALAGLSSATDSTGMWMMPPPEELARVSYSIADAMLAAREAPNA